MLVKDFAGERSLFHDVILNVLSSLETILPRNREMVALLFNCVHAVTWRSVLYLSIAVR